MRNEHKVSGEPNKATSGTKADNRTEKRKIGDLGETIACTFLTKRGYQVVDRNYLRKYGEIDIIARKDGIYRFIEVKTVTRGTKQKENVAVPHETDSYRPEDNVHPWKLKRLGRTIQAYILDKRITEDWQFGVITVELNMATRRANVNYMEDIVL